MLAWIHKIKIQAQKFLGLFEIINADASLDLVRMILIFFNRFGLFLPIEVPPHNSLTRRVVDVYFLLGGLTLVWCRLTAAGKD